MWRWAGYNRPVVTPVRAGTGRACDLWDWWCAGL
jgi:hypothetical protein